LPRHLGQHEPNKDYYPTSGTLTFQPGHDQPHDLHPRSSPTVSGKPNESLSVRLSKAVRATIADAVATGTILNDN